MDVMLVTIGHILGHRLAISKPQVGRAWGSKALSLTWGLLCLFEESPPNSVGSHSSSCKLPITGPLGTRQYGPSLAKSALELASEGLGYPGVVCR